MSNSRVWGSKFLHKYLYLTGEQESPAVFHTWVAISCIQAMLGRRVFVDRGFYTLYPNEFTLLVGASGKVKKDTAIDIGISMIQRCYNAPHFFPGRLNASSLMGHLCKLGQEVYPGTDIAKNAEVFLLAPEFASFVGTGSLGEDFLTVLTDLYKSQAAHRYITRAHGEELLQNVCINLLGGSTIRWLRQVIPESSIGGGFTARVLFIYATEGKARKAEPSRPADFVRIEEGLIADLEQVGLLSGEMAVTNDAKAYTTAWYESLCYADDDVLGPYFERKLDHIYKLAMAMSAIASDEMILTLDHLRAARKMVEELEPGVLEVTKQVAMDAGIQYISRVREVIEKHSPITRTELMRKCSSFVDKLHLDNALDTLLGVYIAQDEKMSKSTRARKPVVTYRKL